MCARISVIINDVYLLTAAKVVRNRLLNRCLFNVSDCAPADCSSDTLDYRFSVYLGAFSMVTVFANDIGAKGCLREMQENG